MEDGMRKRHTHTHLGHYAVQQKLTQYCKSTVNQIKAAKKGSVVSPMFPTRDLTLKGSKPGDL